MSWLDVVVTLQPMVSYLIAGTVIVAVVALALQHVRLMALIKQGMYKPRPGWSWGINWKAVRSGLFLIGLGLLLLARMRYGWDWGLVLTVALIGLGAIALIGAFVRRNLLWTARWNWKD